MTALEHALQSRILCLDGAMGTAIQARALTADDFGGEAFEGCNEHLNLTRPDVIEGIHRGHLEAGADIVETNTFGSTGLVLAEYPPLHEQAHAITLAAARIARRAADAFSTPERPRFVAGSMGPTTKAISVTGGVTFEQSSNSETPLARPKSPFRRTSCPTRKSCRSAALKSRYSSLAARTPVAT